jgi:hypothetical protein
MRDRSHVEHCDRQCRLRRCSCESSTNWRSTSALYAGCVGYFPAGSDMDALIKDCVMYVQAGAGIVADSDPAFEQRECINKAKALFGATEEAKRFASAAGRGQ